jgi:hypothetical protein
MRILRQYILIFSFWQNNCPKNNPGRHTSVYWLTAVLIIFFGHDWSPPQKEFARFRHISTVSQVWSRSNSIFSATIGHPNKKSLLDLGTFLLLGRFGQEATQFFLGALLWYHLRCRFTQLGVLVVRERKPVIVWKNLVRPHSGDWWFLEIKGDEVS